MRKIKKFACAGLVIGIVWIITGCGGASKITEKSKSKSERYYEAASIAWSEENNTLLAIRNLTRSIETNANNDHSHYLLGIIRFSRKEYDEAEKHLLATIRLRQAQGNRSGTAGAQNNLGLLYLHKKQYKMAVALLEESAREVMNREPWLAMGNMGWAYIEMGEYDTAIDWLRRAMFDQPIYCAGLYRLGQAYYFKKEYGKSVVYLKQGLEVPEEGCDRMQEAYRILGLSYLRLEKDAKATKALRQCAEIDRISETGVSCAEALEGL
jgi:tetratricopeptide (TPR) repeat protein